MGCHPNISDTKFPKQGRYLNKPMRVLFNYSDPELRGMMVRDDMEEPFISIIKLEDGRHVLTSECQYSPVI